MFSHFRDATIAQAGNVDINNIEYAHETKYNPGRLVPYSLKKSESIYQSVDALEFNRALWSQCLCCVAILASFTSTPIIFPYSCESHYL